MRKNFWRDNSVPAFFERPTMCDIHLCDNAIANIHRGGPMSLLLLPEEKLNHLLECKECTKRLLALIVLAQKVPASEKVM